jgi:hypothetical protein
MTQNHPSMMNKEQRKLGEKEVLLKKLGAAT